MNAITRTADEYDENLAKQMLAMAAAAHSTDPMSCVRQ